MNGAKKSDVRGGGFCRRGYPEYSIICPSLGLLRRLASSDDDVVLFELMKGQGGVTLYGKRRLLIMKTL